MSERERKSLFSADSRLNVFCWQNLRHGGKKQRRKENFHNMFDTWFLADRTNGRAIATLLRLSFVCNVMYCG